MSRQRLISAAQKSICTPSENRTAKVEVFDLIRKKTLNYFLKILQISKNG
jgi:hypothetical protein